MEDSRIIELLSEMVYKQDTMISELHRINELTDKNSDNIAKNTLAVGELRLSVMRLVDIIEGQVFDRLARLENAVFTKS